MAALANDAMMAALATRRSVKADLLSEPGPTADQLEAILTIAARVPDHKKLVPWRFIVFKGEARTKAGEVFAAACEAEEQDQPSPVRLETERGRFTRAPIVVAVVSRVVPRPGAPEWEQILSTGAAAMNLCHAANALGFGTQWLTEWIAYSPSVTQAFGLQDNERIAGYVHIGTATDAPADRADRDRPDLTNIVTYWDAD